MLIKSHYCPNCGAIVRPHSGRTSPSRLPLARFRCGDCAIRRVSDPKIQAYFNENKVLTLTFDTAETEQHWAALWTSSP